MIQKGRQPCLQWIQDAPDVVDGGPHKAIKLLVGDLSGAFRRQRAVHLLDGCVLGLHMLESLPPPLGLLHPPPPTVHRSLDGLLDKRTGVLRQARRELGEVVLRKQDQ